MYEAVVCTIEVKPHPNADRLQLGVVENEQVVVGLNTRSGDLGVYFPADGQLSHEFCELNDLYPRFDESGKRLNSGFIDPKHRRVRAQNFRGERSYGFWVPVSYFEHYFNYDSELMNFMNIGSSFYEINGRPICNKYETEATIKAKGKRNRSSTTRHEVGDMKMHFETKKFSREIDRLNLFGKEINITEKLHGTSGRFGYVDATVLLPWYKRLLASFGLLPERSRYRHLHGSRKPILETTKQENHWHGRELFRYNVVKHCHGKLRRNEVLYFEIVGHTETGQMIQHGGRTPKHVEHLYPPHIFFTYGCEPKEAKAYVYRITLNGKDLSYRDMVERAKELDLLTPPHLFNVTGLSVEKIKQAVDSVTDGVSIVDHRHMREGVCIRIEDEFGVQILKSKSYYFLLLEDKIKETGVEDIEEASG